MPDPDIARALSEIPAGSKVRLRLSSGAEVEGTIRGSRDGEVQFSDADAVDADLVEDVLMDFVSEGPE